MPFVSLVVAGSEPLREFAENAGFGVLGEAPDYESAKTLLAECGAAAILHYGVPRTDIDPAIPTVVVAPERDLEDLVGLGPFAIVPEGASASLVSAAVTTAEAFARAVRSARDAEGAAREELEARKLVERAKGVLMRRLGLSEEDAYHKLQKASQNENRKMRDVADSIVRTETILTENAPQPTRKRTAG